MAYRQPRTQGLCARAGLTFRGPVAYYQRGAPWPPPPNNILDTEFSKIKKYSVVFKKKFQNFLLYLEKKKELYINNLIESEIQPSLYH
jgi:hypothetical protein